MVCTGRTRNGVLPVILIFNTYVSFVCNFIVGSCHSWLASTPLTACPTHPLLRSVCGAWLALRSEIIAYHTSAKGGAGGRSYAAVMENKGKNRKR